MAKGYCMSEPFIIYRAYKDLSTIECLLMSWIISLNDKKRTICFSNEYAGNILNVSDRTIRTSISKLKSLGFINTYITRDKRFIYLLKQPELKDVSLEVCDISGEEDFSTQGGNNFHTDRKITAIGVENISVRVENSSTYNKEYNIVDNIVVQQEHTTTITLEEELFTEMFVAFETPEDDYDKLFQYWIELPDDEIANSFTYYQNYIDYEFKRKKKPTMYYYFKDKKYNWATIRNWQNGKK